MSREAHGTGFANSARVAEHARRGDADAGEAPILERVSRAGGIGPAGSEGHSDEEGERSRKGPEPEGPGQSSRVETPGAGSVTAARGRKGASTDEASRLTIDSPARPATIRFATTDGAKILAEGPDTLARLMSGIALVVSGVALWLNWQKNERDLAALRPQVGISATRNGIREWKVRLTVVNPLQVPIVWRTVHAEAPMGLELADAQRVESIRESGSNLPFDYSPYRYLREGPTTIEPKASHVWEGYARIADRFAALPEMTPILRPGIDGFDQRPNRFRRMARWIWPSAIRT